MKLRIPILTSRQAVLVMGAALVAALAPAPLLHSPLRLNGSPSVPVGLYRKVAGSGPYAAVCLTDAVWQRAERAGLALGNGECPNGKQPILKPVYLATVAAPIAFTPSGFIVGNHILPHTAPKLRSKTGQPLDHIPFGSYTSGLWAISDFNPDSFDSRYFGAVAKSSIRYYAVPFFVF